MIDLDDVTKVYRRPEQEVRALDGVSLHVEAGEFLAVRGPSGCGKTTILNLIGGLALPTTGRVSVDGEAISAMSSAQRAAFRAENVGFVFQMFHLLPYLNVVQNVVVASPGNPPSQNGRQSPQHRAQALLEKFGLSERLHHHPGQLSAGERQRVAMARALLNGPKLLLADEPTGNLDEASAKRIMELLTELSEGGMTILLVTHQREAAAYAQRTIELSQGKIVSESAAAIG